MPETALIWLRNDLRLADNPALTAALETGLPVTTLYIHETDRMLRPRGGASRWWLHQSLQMLAKDLGKLGVPLDIVEGEAETSVLAAVRKYSATAVFWNRRYAPAQCEIDSAIKSRLKAHGVHAESFGANVLVEPWDIATGAGKPYSVYTPFWNALKDRPIPTTLPAPKDRQPVTASERVDADYEPPHWAAKLAPHWRVGEAAARDKLAAFLADDILDYPDGRDIPAREATSKLSPHLAFGEISPRQVWHAATMHAHRSPQSGEAVQKFLKELVWRDFNYHQLYHREDISRVPMQSRFADLKWRQADTALEQWQRGQTGIPIVDAGMRELWQTGFMQNRVRMLTASLLAKNLLVDWRKGEAWFWDCLVDADIANNPGNWQWVAGSGLDASPYFRIFNPVTQGEKFDADGAYVRRWVPELAKLPDQYVQEPVAAPADVLRKAGVELGTTYPSPVVDLKVSRERALEAFKAL
ncbi:MAG TPA: deoxyribodipyrimidine photo-lyase [Devosia sp.]